MTRLGLADQGSHFHRGHLVVLWAREVQVVQVVHLHREYRVVQGVPQVRGLRDLQALRAVQVRLEREYRDHRVVRQCRVVRVGRVDRGDLLLPDDRSLPVCQVDQGHRVHRAGRRDLAIRLDHRDTADTAGLLGLDRPSVVAYRAYRVDLVLLVCHVYRVCLVYRECQVPRADNKWDHNLMTQSSDLSGCHRNRIDEPSCCSE